MEKGKLAKNNSGSGGLTFTEDIITEIFLWLPLNSLVRFKRLSKRWYFLISHKDSNFRFKYLSALSTRRRNRIVGSHQSDAIMAGFFYQRRIEYNRPSDRVRFLPYTQFKKYDDIRQEQEQEPINPFSSLDESLHKLLSCCVYQDQDQKISIVASSNGFLLCRFRQIYYLVNPVTMEWVALPKFKNRNTCRAVYVGFVCTGDYPSLDLVEYTVVVVSWAPFGGDIFFKFFSSGDNQWTEYTWSCITVQPFDCRRKQNVVIVRSSSTAIINSDDHDQAGGIGIVVYFVVKLLKVMVTAIVIFDLNKGKGPRDNLFQVLQVIETPEPNRGNFRADDCDDYIREFDGVIHYVRILSCSRDFEFWVLNTETRDWCLKHRASLKTMMEGYLWTDVRLWNRAGVRQPVRQPNEAPILYQIHAFHPMNPNLIFLTLHGRMVCYNLQTGTLELVYDFSTQNMLEKYYHYVYQWPCWPPLL